MEMFVQFSRVLYKFLAHGFNFSRQLYLSILQHPELLFALEPLDLLLQLSDPCLAFLDLVCHLLVSIPLL